jgi:hypothetical protein
VLLASGLVSLAGCLPMAAANVGGMAVSAAAGRPESNIGLKEQAGQDCATRAQAYGTVHIINIERHSESVIVVWGTTENGAGRQSFKCVYGTKIRSFTLRALPAQAGYDASTK